MTIWLGLRGEMVDQRRESQSQVVNPIETQVAA
jgi:hypothetical protein